MPRTKTVLSSRQKALLPGQRLLLGIMDSMMADGFDYPVGDSDGKGPYTSLVDKKVYDSWRISSAFAENYSLGIHTARTSTAPAAETRTSASRSMPLPGERLPKPRDFGAPWGNVVVIKHKYLENGRPVGVLFTVRAPEGHAGEKGRVISRRDQIGTIGTGGAYPAHLHLEIRRENMKDLPATYWPSSHAKNEKWVKDHYEDPEAFIKSHRMLTCPRRENRIIIAVKNEYRLFYFEKGTLKKEYEIALSQDPVGPRKNWGI